MNGAPPPRPTDPKSTWRAWASSLHPLDHLAPAVRAHLVTFLGPDPGLVATYRALADEVDIAGVVPGHTSALPRLGDDGLTWHRGDADLETHRYGIRQPRADAAAVPVAAFDVVLVPGRVFDRDGFRLGRGGGHYDRLLAALRRGTTVVGVCPSERIVDRLPRDDHDLPMTHLATEHGVVAIDRDGRSGL